MKSHLRPFGNRLKSMPRLMVLVLFVLIPCEQPVFSKKTQPFAIRVEGQSGITALNTLQPRFKWDFQTKERSTKQSHYQIQVGSSQAFLYKNSPDFWDSGKIASSQSVQVPYQGKTLTSAQTFYWRVKIWVNGKPSEWSTIERFHTGLMDKEALTPDSRLQPLNLLSISVDGRPSQEPKEPGQWQANWIGLDSIFPWDQHVERSRLSARYFRKEFILKGNPTSAFVYLTGLGMFELYVNGRKVGNQVLFPSPTDYTQEVKYTCFDLKPYLKPGRNAIGMVVGNGRFYNMRQNFKPWKIRTFGLPKMLFQLEMMHPDGGRETLVSDASWKATANGPIRSNNEFDGEIYDATKEMPGWNTPGFNDALWLNAQLVKDPTTDRRFFATDKPQNNEPKTPHGNLNLRTARRNGQINEPMKVMDRIEPIRIYQYKPDTFVVDFGQNFAGWVQLNVKGPRGKSIKIHYAENIEKDGRIYIDNLRSALTTDIYTLKGEGVESWEPKFVYHGFRYMEVVGWPGTPVLENFVGKLVYDAVPTTGTFQSSDSTLNGIFKNAWWGIASNYKGMPVDCPQRDERQPWLGDRSNGCWGESYLFDNQRLYAKWVDDIQQSMSQEGQIPDIAPNYYNYYTDNMTWPGTYLLVSYMLYRQFGDTAVIQKHYPYMKKWLNYMENKYLTTDGIMKRDKYGDWCMPPESPELIHSADTSRITEGALIGTAYYYRMLKIMQEFSAVMQLPNDCQEFAQKASRTATAFQNAYFNPSKHCYGNNTATANILPLALGITPDAEAEAVFKNIEDLVVNKYDTHICTGVIGTAWFMRTLSRFGRGDLAYKIASTRSYPSWGYMLDKGATTIWELWNGDTANPWMNSQNHVMLLGDLLVWYYEHLAGIRNADGSNAFRLVEMKPDFPVGLEYVNATYKSIRGLISSSWRFTNVQFSWTIAIPFNTEALVYLPTNHPNTVLESGKPVSKTKGVTFVRMEQGRSVFRIGSGNYHFTIQK